MKLYSLVKFGANEMVRLNGEETYFIPMEEGNRFYDAYLHWLAEGNEPEPVEE